MRSNANASETRLPLTSIEILTMETALISLLWLPPTHPALQTTLTLMSATIKVTFLERTVNADGF